MLVHKDLVQNGGLKELVTELKLEGMPCHEILLDFSEDQTYALVLQELICLVGQELVPCKNWIFQELRHSIRSTVHQLVQWR